MFMCYRPTYIAYTFTKYNKNYYVIFITQKNLEANISVFLFTQFILFGRFLFDPFDKSL